MEIAPIIDLSSIDDIKEYADKYYEDIVENRSYVTTCICIVKGKLNEKLQEKREVAYEAIAVYCKSEEFLRAAQNDYELNCFKTAANIYQLERGFDNTIFDNIEYVDSFAKVYEQTVHYFMRIQFGFTKAQCIDCMAYFRRNKLSVFAIVQMLMESAMGEKDRIALTLADYYIEQGLYKEAMYIVSVFEEQGNCSYKNEFADKKRAINGLTK